MRGGDNNVKGQFEIYQTTQGKTTHYPRTDGKSPRA